MSPSVRKHTLLCPVKTQISLHFTVWSKSSVSAWRNDASLAIQNAPSEDSQLALYNLSKVFRVCMREWCILGYPECIRWRQSACTLQSEQSPQSLHEGMMHPWLSKMHLVKTVSLHFTIWAKSSECMREWCILGYPKCTQWRQSACTLQSEQSLQSLHEGMMHPWLFKMHPVKTVSLHFTIWAKSSESAWGNDASLAIQNASGEDNQLALYSRSKSSVSTWGNNASLAIQNASSEDNQLLYSLIKVFSICMRERCIFGYPKCTQWRF